MTRGSGYVALGDSVTFGYQEPQVVPAPNYFSAASFPGYPEQLGTALHLKVANFSCPGETAASLVNDTAPSNGCENGYRKALPAARALQGLPARRRRHLSARSPRRPAGLADDRRQRPLPLPGRARVAARPPCCARTLASISANIKRTLSAVRGRAGYHGQIVILNYFSLNYSVPSVSAFSLSLNQAQDSAARPFGVRIADGYGEFKAGASKFGASPCLAGLITQLGDVRDLWRSPQLRRAGAAGQGGHGRHAVLGALLSAGFSPEPADA